jgi:hypothetical protein
MFYIFKFFTNLIGEQSSLEHESNGYIGHQEVIIMKGEDFVVMVAFVSKCPR